MAAVRSRRIIRASREEKQWLMRQARAAEAGAAEPVGSIPRDYNFAADVLQRNLAAGRADKPAYIDAQAHAHLSASSPTGSRVSAPRCADLGIRREERVLLALLDTVDWPIAFLGCLKAGIIAVPVNTLLTEDDYRFMLADSRAKCLVVSEALFPKFEKLIKRMPGPRARHRLRRQSARLPAVRGCHRRGRAGALHRADNLRRHGVLALHLGLHRQAEGRRACAREPQAHRRSLRHAGRRPEGKRRGPFGGQAVLRLRPRQRHDLPAVGRRHHRAQSRAADAGWRRRVAAQTSDHRVLRRADLLCRVPRQPDRAEEI